jgi:CheY-like chemotaxis protein
VESEQGTGTTVSFCVSFGESTSPPKKTATPQTDIEPSLAGLDILVAEDDSISATMMKWLLEKNGCTVMTVENGAEALQALTEHAFHAVFLDIQMPVMDGLETVQAIRRGKAGSEQADIPVIALTAFAMKGDRERFLNKGMNDYLSKPVDLQQLQAILQQVVNRRQE